MLTGHQPPPEELAEIGLRRCSGARLGVAWTGMCSFRGKRPDMSAQPSYHPTVAREGLDRLMPLP
jgi:hypothetical protein